MPAAATEADAAPRNALAAAASAYLRSHADQAIDWRPWAETSLAEAHEGARPILLSIGFAACHWCHVMARESFDDELVAAAINRYFLPIKVDREEHPEVDAYYQRALAAMGGQRGWPLTLFLTPEGEAAGGGGYFDREGLLEAIDGFVGGERRLPVRAAARSTGIEGAPDAAALDQAARTILAQMDPLAGGLLGLPKFPNLPIIEALFRAADRTGDATFERSAIRSLERMCLGGLHDPIDGGFARYAVDRHWQVPHYEKMLADNALFVALLTIAWRRSRKPLFAERVAQTIEWMVRRLRLSSGALGASLSAEAGGVEGGDRIWAHAEIATILGDETPFFATFYDIAAPGAPAAPLRQRREALLAAHGIRLSRCLERLRLAPKPSADVDDKVITEWNALTIRGLASASATFNRPDWFAFAESAWNALAATGGKVQRVQGIEGLLDDQAALGLAAVTLFETSGDRTYLDRAIGLAQEITQNFAYGSGLLVRSRTSLGPISTMAEVDDSAVPSGNAQALELFVRLAAVGDESWIAAARDALFQAAVPLALAEPIARAGLLNAADLLLRATTVTLDLPDLPASRSWRSVVFSAPGLAYIVQLRPGPELLALLCREGTCDLPIGEEKLLRAALA